jgi:glyoxylase-like metal-dependent hydrolase (beta-lactamase superfamily II)
MVLMTHLHPDHEAGLLDAGGKAVFPNAELAVHEDELAFWRDDSAMARASDEGKGDFALARTALAAYRDRIRTVKTDEVLPGVRAFPTPGHTPGHTAWLAESNGDALLIWGDVIHFPGIQFAIPEASVAFDIDSQAAAVARRKVLDFAAGERLRVAGIHLDFPTFGYVVPSGTSYRFIQDVWRPSI